MEKETVIKGINSVYLEVKPLVEKVEAEKKAAMRVAIEKVGAYKEMKVEAERLEALKSSGTATDVELTQLETLKSSMKEAKKEAKDAQDKLKEVKVRLESAKMTVKGVKDQLKEVPGYNDYFELVIAKKLERSINQKTEENAKIDERAEVINQMKELSKDKEADKALRTVLNASDRIKDAEEKAAILKAQISELESKIAEAKPAEKALLNSKLDSAKAELEKVNGDLAKYKADYDKALSKYSAIADKAGVELSKDALAGTIAVISKNGISRDDKGSIDMKKTLGKTLKIDGKAKKSNEKQLMNLVGAYQETPDHIAKMAMDAKGGVNRKQPADAEVESTATEVSTSETRPVKKLHWYNFFGRFSRWMRKRKALAAPEAEERAEGMEGAATTEAPEVNESSYDEFRNIYKVDVNKDSIEEEFMARQRRAKQALKEARAKEDEEDLDR